MSMCRVFSYITIFEIDEQCKFDARRRAFNTYALGQPREDSTHGHHQMSNTKIRLIMFFATKDGEALYSQQKQDWELTVA